MQAMRCFLKSLIAIGRLHFVQGVVGKKDFVLSSFGSCEGGSMDESGCEVGFEVDLSLILLRGTL